MKRPVPPGTGPAVLGEDAARPRHPSPTSPRSTCWAPWSGPEENWPCCSSSPSKTPGRNIVGLVNYPGARSILDDLYRAAVARRWNPSPTVSQFVAALFPGGQRRSFPADRPPRLREPTRRSARPSGDGRSTPWPEVPGFARSLGCGQRPPSKMLRIAMDHRPGSSATLPREPSAGKAAHREGRPRPWTSVRLPSPAVSDAESYLEAVGARRNADRERGPAVSRETDQSTTDQLLRVGAAPLIHLPDRPERPAVDLSGSRRLLPLRRAGTRRLSAAPRRSGGSFPAGCRESCFTPLHRQPAARDCVRASTRVTSPPIRRSSSAPASTNDSMRGGTCRPGAITR